MENYSTMYSNDNHGNKQRIKDNGVKLAKSTGENFLPSKGRNEQQVYLTVI